jgi:FkbM family methyltransferase
LVVAPEQREGLTAVAAIATTVAMGKQTMETLRKFRVALTPRSWVLKRRLANGAVVYGQNRSGYGGRGIYIFGEAIRPEFEHFEEFLGSEGVFLDIGSSTGIFTIKAAKHYGDRGMVIAVDPSLEELSMLARSISANGFTNVRLRNLCVAAHTGLRTLYLNFDKPNSFSLEKFGAAPQSTSVLAISLNDLCKWEQLTRLDYVKISTVGSEEEILSTALETVQRFRPIIQFGLDMREFQVTLPDYGVFRAPGSSNKVCIPNEHPKFSLGRELGWLKVDG